MDIVLPVFLGLALLVFFSRSFIVLLEYERAVTFWLGKLADLKQPGLRFVFWPFVTFQKVSLRTIVHDVPPQDVITRDNVSVQVNAVVYYRVVDPEKAVTEIEDYNFATSQLAQTTLRSVLGQADLDELLSERDKLNDQLQEIVDAQTDPWGIKVTAVEVKHVDLPQTMQRAMARQAEAEREKRAKVIHAEGEFQASRNLAKAADEVSKNAVTLQLRYLQTLTDIATERNSTIIFPLPIELMRAFGAKIGMDLSPLQQGPGADGADSVQSVDGAEPEADAAERPDPEDA